MLPFPLAILGALVTGLLAAAAVVARALTPAAGAVAAAFGIVIVTFVGFAYLALLILFVAASVLATRYGFEQKRSQHLQEGRAGERGVSNVVAHIVIPTGLAVAGGTTPAVLPADVTALFFASALAFGGADTFASEFGVLSGRAKSILTGRPVPPGTNGGVSRNGQLAALGAAATTAAVGLGVYLGFRAPVPNPVFFVVTVTVAGFLGCQVDSVLGELLENRGILTKGTTNLLGMLSAVGIAAVVLAVVGGAL